MTKRSRVEIVSDILLYIKRHDGMAKPTNILYRANLSMALMKKYMAALLKDGLIIEIKEGTKKLYGLTEKGAKLINMLHELNPMTDIIEVYRNKRAEAASRRGF